MLSKYLHIQYVYLFISIIWMPFAYYTNIDNAGRVPMVFSIMFILSFIKRKVYRSIYSNFPIKVMLFLIIYMIISYLTRNVIEESLFVRLSFLYKIVNVFLVLTIVYYEILLGRIVKILNLLIFSSYSWLFFALLLNGFNMSISTRTLIDGIDGNDFALVGIFIIYCAYIKSQVLRHYSLIKILVLSLIPFLLIVFTGSRTAFGCLVVILLFAILGQFKKVTPNKLILILLSSIMIYIVLDYVFAYTIMGSRIISTTTQSDDIGLVKTGTILDYMGDRGVFYYYGWKEFIKDPLWGIGFMNFAPLMVYNGFVCHSEYVVQYCENGLIGISLFVIFLLSLLNRINKFSIIERRSLYVGFFIVTFISLFFWTYDRFYIYIIYAIILGLTNKR